MIEQQYDDNDENEDYNDNDNDNDDWWGHEKNIRFCTTELRENVLKIIAFYILLFLK